MTSITIVSAEELDLDEYVGLQVAAYKAHLGRYQLNPDFMNASLYSWKYSPPAGAGKVALARESGSLLAAVAVLPLWIEGNGRRCLLWRAVDIATLPAARGKGLFTKLLSALREDLEADEVLGSFPNSNSTPGFKKIGAGDASYAPTWVRPVLPGLRSKREARPEVETFSSIDAETLRALTVEPGVSSFVRDVDYLNWRYRQHPDHSYHIHFADEVTGDAGLIVFRETRVYNRRVVLLLEWWAPRGGRAADMLRFATDYCREHGVRYMITVSNTLSMARGLRTGFARVPRSMAPKEQVLRGVPSGAAAREVLFNTWALQMGDLLEF